MVTVYKKTSPIASSKRHPVPEQLSLGDTNIYFMRICISLSLSHYAYCAFDPEVKYDLPGASAPLASHSPDPALPNIRYSTYQLLWGHGIIPRELISFLLREINSLVSAFTCLLLVITAIKLSVDKHGIYYSMEGSALFFKSSRNPPLRAEADHRSGFIR